MTSIIQRLKNLIKLSEVEIKDGKLLPPSVKFEEKPPKMAEIIHLKDTEKIINDLIENK